MKRKNCEGCQCWKDNTCSYNKLILKNCPCRSCKTKSKCNELERCMPFHVNRYGGTV